MVYNESKKIEVPLTGTHLEDRYSLNSLSNTEILKKYGFRITNPYRDPLSLPDINQLSYAESAEIIFKRRGERILSATIYAKEPLLEETLRSLLGLIEESKPKMQNGS